MADSKPTAPPSPEEQAPQEEVDLLFKFQMWLFDLVTRWWKRVAIGVGVYLAGTLVYGLFDSWRTSRALEASAEIAQVDFRMPKGDQLAQLGLTPLDDLNDPARVANLEAGARKYTEAAAGAPATQAAVAHLKAAETWERLQRPEEARKSYQAALDAQDDGPAGFAAKAGLAALALGEGKPEEAARLYRELADANRDVLGEHALGRLLRLHHAQKDDARVQELLGELGSRYADSPRAQALAAELGLTLPAAPAAQGS